MSGRARVLLVTGSTRDGSVNTAALTTMAAAAPSGVTAVLYDGLAGLPAFNPDHDGDRLPEAAAGLRRQIAAAVTLKPGCPGGRTLGTFFVPADGYDPRGPALSSAHAARGRGA